MTNQTASPEPTTLDEPKREHVSAACCSSAVGLRPYYDRDGMTIYCCDCRKLIPDLRGFDLLLTDPPFGLANRLSGGTWGAKFGGGLVWDQEAASYVRDAVATAKWSIVWGGNYFGMPASRCWLVWRKPDAVRTMADCELAWTNLDQNSRCRDYTIAATNGERGLHPTPKPLSLMKWCLSLVPDAQSVFDPFMGSGTTLLAAKIAGQRAVGVEIEERYCEIAARRLEQGVLF